MARALAFFIATAAFIIASASCAFAATVGTINGNSVNVRAGSSTGAKVLTQVSKGQTVFITGQSGDFYHVYFTGVDSGYISTQLVTVKSDSSQSTEKAKTDTSTGVKGEVKGNSINIRSTPSTDGKVLGKVNSGDKLTALALTGNWYKVMYNGVEAYITADFFSAPGLAATKPAEPAKKEEPVQLPVVTQQAGEPAAAQTQEVTAQTDEASEDSIYAVVLADIGLYLRKEPSLEADILNALAMGEVADVLSIEDEWIQVVYSGQTGYLSKEFIEIMRGKKPDSIQNSSGNPLIDDMISYAKQFLGTPYVYGGNSLTKGVDCSGFVYAVLGNFGISVERSSASMAYANGAIVQKSQIAPGDLVFFDTDGSNNGQVSHVGIYIGSGKFIHSSSSKRTWGVTISNLNDDYYTRTYVVSKRII